MTEAVQLLSALLLLVRSIVESGKDPLVELRTITKRYADAKREFDAATKAAIREKFR